MFIELNVEETDEQNDVLKIHTATASRKVHSAKREEPGEFFHPLLGTLITGAARLSGASSHGAHGATMGVCGCGTLRSVSRSALQ